MSKVNQGGRPSVYDKRIAPNLKALIQLRELGYSHEELFTLLDISKTSYYKHKREIDEFTHSFSQADAKLIDELEVSLYDLANGKAKKIVETERLINGIMQVVEKRIETLPPNASSLQFALTNLKGDKWKHKQEHISNYNEEDMQTVKSFTDTFIDAMKDRNEKD